MRWKGVAFAHVAAFSCAVAAAQAEVIEFPSLGLGNSAGLADFASTIPLILRADPAIPAREAAAVEVEAAAALPPSPRLAEAEEAAAAVRWAAVQWAAVR